MSAFILEANRENDVLKISLYEQTQHIAHRHYSEKKFNKKEIDNLCQTLISLIDKNTPTSTISEDHYNKIHQYALLLYDTLFPLEIKKKIKDANFTILTFAIDESLVPIPWELLHDGTNFLCLKFAVGRIVRTKQPFLFSQHRETKKPPLKMLLLSNPTGNLEYAYQECLSIRRQLDKKEIINVDTKTTEIDLAYVKRYIRNYDIVHFAGHAEYDQQNPENSGWRLTDGLFSPQIILSLGDSALFPSLIFSNACYSEGNRQWQQDNRDGEEKNYGLASAFLLGGVNHYISTLCRVSDNACLHFSKSFYQQIAKNSSIGESIRQGRLKLIETYGKQSIGWTSYVLYGDPGQSLFSSLSLSETNRKQENKKKKTLRLGALCLSIFCVIISLLYPIYKKKTIVQRHDEKLKNTESTIDQPPKTINWSSAERSGLDGYNALMATSIPDGLQHPTPPHLNG